MRRELRPAQKKLLDSIQKAGPEGLVLKHNDITPAECLQKKDLIVIENRSGYRDKKWVTEYRAFHPSSYVPRPVPKKPVNIQRGREILAAMLGLAAMAHRP